MAVYSRSPAAYHGLKSLGVLQLPCDRTLRRYMTYQTSGIDEEVILEKAKEYNAFKKKRVQEGFVKPVGEGVLMWDEVKVSKTLYM